jgi:hypothetical protein
MMAINSTVATTGVTARALERIGDPWRLITAYRRQYFENY